jgi:hypothetical protein
MEKVKTKDVCLRLTEKTAKDLKDKAEEMNTFQSTIAEKGIKRELERMRV